MLEVVEFMADATTVPILLDGDTGYGNFNSARRLVTKLEQRGVAGVCIEDKLFPKTNSFIRGDGAAARGHGRVRRQDPRERRKRSATRTSSSSPASRRSSPVTAWRRR